MISESGQRLVFEPGEGQKELGQRVVIPRTICERTPEGVHPRFEEQCKINIFSTFYWRKANFNGQKGREDSTLVLSPMEEAQPLESHVDVILGEF